MLRAKETQEELTQLLKDLEMESHAEVFALMSKFVENGFRGADNTIERTVEPGSLHNIKQSVFNFYIDYSVRCVLKL